jgi:mono/diheme cytochrome c family protein
MTSKLKMNVRAYAGVLVALAPVMSTHVLAQDFAPEQIRKGAGIYAQNCSPCHGAHMADPNSAFDLKTFPPDAKNRFVNSVTHGKNSMPPWGDILKSDDIEALWAYVRAGER